MNRLLSQRIVPLKPILIRGISSSVTSPSAALAMAMPTPFPSSPQTRALGPEMVAFNKAYLYPTPAYELAKSQIREKVSACVANTMSEYDLALFGSTATGLGLGRNDLDFALIPRDPPDRLMPTSKSGQGKLLNRLDAVLRRAHLIRNSTVIRGAMVPLVKCLSAHHSAVPMDFIISRGDGERTTRYLMEALREEPLLQPLVVLVRGITTHRRVGTAVEHGLGSYATSLLVHWYVAAWKAESGISRPGHDHLGEIIIGFLEYFSLRFTYSSHCLLFGENGQPLVRSKMDEAIAGLDCVRPGKNPLVLLDPSIPGSNAARAARRLPEICAVFRLALGRIARHCGVDALAEELAARAEKDLRLITPSPLPFNRKGTPPLPGNIFYEMLCEEGVPMTPATQHQVIPTRRPTVGAKRVSNGGKGEVWNGHVWKLDKVDKVDKVAKVDAAKPTLPPSNQAMDQRKIRAQIIKKRRKDKKVAHLLKDYGRPEWDPDTKKLLPGATLPSLQVLRKRRIEKRREEKLRREANVSSREKESPVIVDLTSNHHPKGKKQSDGKARMPQRDVPNLPTPLRRSSRLSSLPPRSKRKRDPTGEDGDDIDLGKNIRWG